MKRSVKESLLQYSWLLSELRSFLGARAKEITTPSIIAGDAKGSMAIRLNGESAHLARSNVLHLMATAAEIGNCYSIQRVFREEREETRFHLAEFDLLDSVFVQCGLEDILSFVETMILEVRDHAAIEFGEDAVAKLSGKEFARIDWERAAKEVGERSVDDLSHEILYDAPYFIVNLPVGQVSWALKDSENGRKRSFNLILPTSGEVAEGGERDLNGLKMQSKFDRIGRAKQLGWYAEAVSRLEGPVVSFGIGVERLAMWLFKKGDISDVNLFYRKLGFSEIYAHTLDGEKTALL